MTRTPDCTLSDELVELIADAGLDVVPELVRIIINSAMHAERQQHLHAAPYERTEERRGYANGFKPKTITTRSGKITFAVPHVRDGSFSPQALEKGLRSERAFTLALAEMHVQGVSTRKVATITEQLYGVELTGSADLTEVSTQVSRAVAQLYDVLERWRTRPLGERSICCWMLPLSLAPRLRASASNSPFASPRLCVPVIHSVSVQAPPVGRSFGAG